MIYQFMQLVFSKADADQIRCVLINENRKKSLEGLD